MITPANITIRKLTRDEALILIEGIKNTPNITAYTLRQWLRCKHVVVATNREGRIMGAVMNDDFTKHWTEIAVVFVLEEFRRQGLGREIFEIAHAFNIRRNKNILMMSREPNVTRMMEELGFELHEGFHYFSNMSQIDSFILRYYYEIRAKLSLFRLREVARKKKIYGVCDPFMYGIIWKNSPVKIKKKVSAFNH